jgi:hypothetical protein
MTTPPEEIYAIRLSNPERNSGLDRVKYAEGLILQLPATHCGRNTWLLNYGYGPEAVRMRQVHNAERAQKIAEPAKPEVISTVVLTRDMAIHAMTPRDLQEKFECEWRVYDDHNRPNIFAFCADITYHLATTPVEDVDKTARTLAWEYVKATNPSAAKFYTPTSWWRNLPELDRVGYRAAAKAIDGAKK